MFPAATPAAAPGLHRAQERRNVADLPRGQLGRVLMHDLVLAQVRREGLELLLDIAAMLAGEAREDLVALRLVAMAGHAGGHALRVDAVLEDLPAGGDFGGIG